MIGGVQFREECESFCELLKGVGGDGDATAATRSAGASDVVELRFHDADGIVTSRIIGSDECILTAGTCMGIIDSPILKS